MNPHSEISPSTQLLLKELRKLRKLFDKFDAYVRESSRGVSIPTQCAIVGADIVADNWGGLFDGGNGSNEQQFEARSTVADNWGGLFEQPAHIPEERDLAFSAIDVFGSESSCLGSVLEFDLACPEQFDDNVAATEYTHSDPDVSACVTTAPTASAADSVAIWEVEPEESLPAEYPQQIQEPEEKRHDANIVALEEALSKREAEAGTRALAKPPRLRVSCRWRPLWRSVRFVSLERSDPILQTLRMCPTRKHGFHYPVRARVHRPRLPPVRQWPHGPRARTRALASRQGRRRHWSRRLRVRHRARHHAGVGADRHLPCPRRPPRRVRLPRWLLRALAAGPRLHRRRLRRLHPLRPRRPHHHGVPPLSSPPHRSANAIPHSDCLHGAALSLPTASLAGRLSQSALLCIDALVSLVLPGNRLFVTLPDTLPPHLHALDLPGNAISGGIPVSLVACESLNLPSTRCSMQVHYSNFSSGLLHPSPVAPVSTLPTPAVLMTMAPFPASTTASTAGVNFSSNIIHNQDTGWVLGKVAHKQLWPPPVQCEIRGDVVQMLICIAWISPDQNALEVLSFQVQQPWPPPTVFPLRPLPWPSFSNYAASVLCELKFDGVQSWPFFCSYAVLVHLNTSELAVLHWMSFGCIQTVECSLDWSFRIGTTTSGTSGAAFLVVTDDSSDHCTLLRQLDSAKAQRNLHMHAPGCLIVNHIILVPWKLWSWFNGYTSDMITQLLIPWSPCVWICSSALMITSSVLLRTLLLSQAVTLDFCSKLMLLAMGFLTTSKEVQYSTNCLSWTYSLSHEPFGTSLLITIAAMGSTMDSILECGLDKSKIVWNPGAQLRSFLHSNSLDAFKICYSLPRKPPWSLLAHHSFRTMHAKTVDSGKHMTVTTKVSFHMFIQEERQQKCGGPVGLAWHKDCLIVPKWLSDRVMACLILYGEAIPVFLCCVITTVLLLLEFLKLKENWQCAVSLVPTRLGVTRAGALLQEPMQKNHKESSSNTNVIMSTHRRTYNMRVTASSTVQAHPYLALWCLSDASFSLPSRPEKIATVGVGYIALEFAGDIKGLQSVVQAFKIWLHRPTRADYSVVISAMFSQLSIRLVGLTTDEVPKHEFQQFPWDPGGSVLLYRLGGKPILKKGGMLGISHDWAFTEAVGLAPAHTSPGTLDWRLQMPKANSGTDIEHYRTNSYQVANIAEQQQGPGIVACYQGTWVMEEHVLGIVALQQTFVPRSGDVVLVSPPKCGTTWLKALPFATMARGAYPPDGADHPLLRHNPHDCVPYM